MSEPKDKLNAQLSKKKKKSRNYVQPGPFHRPKLDPRVGLVGIGCGEAWGWESGCLLTSLDNKKPGFYNLTGQLNQICWVQPVALVT